MPTGCVGSWTGIQGTRKMESLLGNLMLTYKKKWNSIILMYMALAELQKETYSGFYTTVTNFNTDQFGYNNLQAGAITALGRNKFLF